MTKALHCGLIATALTVAGCATNPPLMFGDTTTYGLRLGNDTATGGGSVSLGYKAHSIAVVPVSVLDENGKPWLLKGHGRGNADAMSVFASFESDAGTARADGAASAAATNATVRLGQVFSTGLAAQVLTRGYVCRETADPSCTKTVVATALEAAAAADTSATLAGAAAASANNAAAAVTAAMANQPVTTVQATASTQSTASSPYQAPLLFLRSDVVGIDIGGSLAEQGLQFDLGYTNRNLALIPVYAAGAGGKVVRIAGASDGAASDRSNDAMSVLGQFKVNTETTRLGLGLGRYFATGVAARNMGESISAAIAKIPSETPESVAALVARAPSTPASSAGR